MLISFFDVQYLRVHFSKSVKVKSFGKDPSEQKYVHELFSCIIVEKFAKKLEMFVLRSHT